jgi:hypothetical protein
VGDVEKMMAIRHQQCPTGQMGDAWNVVHTGSFLPLMRPNTSQTPMKRRAPLLVIFIKNTLGDGVGRAIVPTGIIGMSINTDGYNDACANIRTTPFTSTSQKLAPDEKITVVHAGRYEVVHVRSSRAARR